MAKKNYSGWTIEQLIEELNKLKKRKKYGLVWEDKEEDVVEQCKKELPILEEIVNNEIRLDSEKAVNILIEGDNYHALSVLNYTHKGKIDLIYIDPPYNTGAKNWKYNNDYVDSEDTYRHSKWISFMHHRLKIAKNLLKKNGVLICAIDHNEQEALGLLLDDLFFNHEKVCVTIIHNPGGIQGDNFSYTHEYAYFVFPKGEKIINKVIRDKADIVALRDWGGDESKRESSKNGFYPIYVKDNNIIGFGDVCADDFHPESANIQTEDGSIAVYPIDSNGVERKWRHARQSVEGIKDELFCVEQDGEIQVKRSKSIYRYKTVWTDKRFNANTYGSKLLNNIIDTKFPYPKSLYNLEECLKATVGNRKNAIILDYFAGSGTTGHAVLELNRKDNGNRSFILVTNNEGDIAEDVTLKRMKNIMVGYDFKGKTNELLFEKKLSLALIKESESLLKKLEEIEIENKSSNYYTEINAIVEDDHFRVYGEKKIDARKEGLGGNLKYYKTAFVKAEITDRGKRNLVDRSTELLCLKESCFDIVKSDQNYKIFKNSKNKYLGIVYDDDGIGDFINEVQSTNQHINTYVFSLDDSVREEEFEKISHLIELKPIPEVILNVYRRIFR